MQFQIWSGLSQEAGGFTRPARPVSGRLAHLLARRRRRRRRGLAEDPIRPPPDRPLCHRQQQGLVHGDALFEFPIGGWRAIGSVADDHRRRRPGHWAALQATISPYTRSGSSNGSMASTLTSAFKASAATTWVYSPLTANRLTIESFSLPVRL